MKYRAFFLAVIAALTYCKKTDGAGSAGSGPTGETSKAYTTSAEIGAAGGTISDPKGNWSLTIPAGALSSTRTITVTTNATATGAIANTYSAKTPVLRFEPAGLTFLTPATLILTYEQGTMPEGKLEEKLLKYYYVKDDSSVAQTSATVNMTTNQITAQIPHFSFSVGLTINIALVNIGIISNPVVVQNIANNVIAHLQSLPNDAARNQEFADNQALLTNFMNKLVDILGADVVTAAFPNADFDGDGFPNSSDPLVGGPPPIVTLASSGSLFVSTNAGAINSTQFTWRSNTSGTFEIRRNGTNCTDGTLVQSGAVTANNDNTHTPINASALNPGANSFRICATAASLTGSLLVTIQRDESLPVSSASPAGGTYASAQNVAMTCLDSGVAQCAQIAYTTNGTDPTFDAAGNVTNGTLVTGMWLMPLGNTTVKIASRDTAGNIGSILTIVYVANPPTVLTSTPADAALGIAPCSGNPCTGKIVIIFSGSMNSSLTQTLTTEVYNGSSYITAPSAGTLFTWSTTTVANDTLTLNYSGSWYRFPENTTIRYTLASTGLKDLAGHAIAANVQRTFTTSATGGFVVSDTGVTGCYNDTTSMACAGNAGSWPSQDGDFSNVPNARSFSGPTQYFATTDYTTTDNLTGLVWKSCPEGLSGPSCTTGTATTFTWYNTLNQCSALNAMNAGAGYSGRNNWRLPNSQELESLPNYSVNGPAIDTVYFPATGSNFYWSASSYAGLTANAWYVDGFTGRGSNIAKTNAYLIRCVSASNTPLFAAGPYTDNSDGTVTDQTTALRWQKCSMGQNNDGTCSGAATNATWSSALQYCNNLTLATKTWRLPSINELKSLVDKSTSNPSIRAVNFPATASNFYWSATNYSPLPGTAAWNIYFPNGYTDLNYKYIPYMVRCVTTGP